METTIGQVHLAIVQGDITGQGDVDAVSTPPMPTWHPVAVSPAPSTVLRGQGWHKPARRSRPSPQGRRCSRPPSTCPTAA